MDTLPPTAWQPLTPKGVAAFAYAPLRRLLLVQFIVAIAVAVGVALLCYDRYVPVIEAAIEKLPASSQVRQQQFDWRGNSPVVLAENRFLSLMVDLDRTGQLRPVAHAQLEFSRTNIVVRSLFGYVELPYAKGWTMAVSREELLPRWGAWRPALLAGVIGAVLVSLFASWLGLAFFYTLPVWWLGFFLNRELSWSRSWKLSGAALMPGALLMLAGISFYDLGVTDLVGMLFLLAAHLVVGWVYLGLGIWAAARVGSVAGERKNPFGLGGGK
ncbi:MAG: hypothetical protein QM813_08710 [Verrucomicrobiota bacterium]